jgi:hypothetical protein
MMTSPVSLRQLTRGAGWTFDEAEAWLRPSLTLLLLNQNTKRVFAGRSQNSTLAFVSCSSPGAPAPAVAPGLLVRVPV